MLKQIVANTGIKKYTTTDETETVTETETETETVSSEVKERVDILEKKLDMILENLKVVQKDTDKMSSHINFINDVYSKVKSPLFWICDRVNYMSGYAVTYIPGINGNNKSLKNDINDQD